MKEVIFSIVMFAIHLTLGIEDRETTCLVPDQCKTKDELDNMFHYLFENEPHAPCLNESIRPYVNDERLVSLKSEKYEM